MEQSQLPFLTIAELARLIKTQEVSPVEVIEAHLERIERLNTQLHAFFTVCHEDARRGVGRDHEPGGTRGDAELRRDRLEHRRHDHADVDRGEREEPEQPEERPTLALAHGPRTYAICRPANACRNRPNARMWSM